MTTRVGAKLDAHADSSRWWIVSDENRKGDCVGGRCRIAEPFRQGVDDLTECADLS